jgi:hypothetical protein
MIGRMFKTALAFLITLVVFDVVGIGVCFIFEVVPFRRGSSLALFAVWFVLGVFCGLISYMQGGPRLLGKEEKDWTGREDAGRIGAGVIGVASAVLAVLSGLSWLLWWSSNADGEYYVPDSMAPTLTFFGTILASMVFARNLFKPSKKSDDVRPPQF